jgi:hypothetical protein
VTIERKSINEEPDQIRNKICKFLVKFSLGDTMHSAEELLVFHSRQLGTSVHETCSGNNITAVQFGTNKCLTVKSKKEHSFLFVVLPSSTCSQQVSRLFIFT